MAGLSVAIIFVCVDGVVAAVVTDMQRESDESSRGKAQV
jgi:hypothetical protein